MLRPSAKAFGYVVVSVGDMSVALDLWVGRFGMQIARRRAGGDDELAAVWGLPAGAIADQALLETPDNPREIGFFRELLGLETISHHRFTGPEIERVVGLPAGAGLDITMLGDPQVRFGRLELVQYEGARGRDLYPRAAPPGRGMLSVTYAVPDFSAVIGRGRAAGLREHGRVHSILAEGRMASVTSPAGLRVDIIEA